MQKEEVERDLFMSNEDSNASQELMRIIDEMNQKHGRSMVRFAAEGKRKQNSWQMKRQNVTPAYTTDWKQLPVAYAR